MNYQHLIIKKMLKREDIIKLLREQRTELHTRFSVKRIGLFGSFESGDATEASDIDLLVDFIETTFDNYMDLKFYLEDIFQRPVDLVLSETLKPRIRPIVEQEVSYV